MDDTLYVIVGPTASGKTSRAVALAKALHGEIISADSRQVYRNMDIGTGKDLDEYDGVIYHLIDVCPAGYKYNLFEYLRDFKQAYQDINERHSMAVLCGGTGLYVESVLNGIELPPVPENKTLREELSSKSLVELAEILKEFKTLHNTTDVDSCKRAIRAIEIQKYYHENPDLKIKSEPHPLTNFVLVGVDIDRQSRRDRITSRLRQRLENGMVDEVSNLLKGGISPDDLIYYGLEYKFITKYVIGELSYDEMFSQLEIAIHQFAKRQMTWFRGMERRGFTIHWLDWRLSNEEFVDAVMALRNSR